MRSRKGRWVTFKRRPLRKVMKVKEQSPLGGYSRLWRFTLTCGHNCLRWRGSMKYVRCQDCASIKFKEWVPDA